MTKRFLFTLSIAISVFFINCSPSDKSEASVESIDNEETIITSYKDITQEEFKALESNLPEDVVILDVRTDQEVAGGTIEGAIQIDYRGENFRDEIARLDTSKTYVVYCHLGGRSAATSQMMSDELGFSNVNNLLGGYSEYSEEN